jgi:hypothetical protein
MGRLEKTLEHGVILLCEQPRPAERETPASGQAANP